MLMFDDLTLEVIYNTVPTEFIEVVLLVNFLFVLNIYWLQHYTCLVVSGYVICFLLKKLKVYEEGKGCLKWYQKDKCSYQISKRLMGICRL